jgi:hypothetical protein
MTRIICFVYKCVNNLDGNCEELNIEVDEGGVCLCLDTEKKYEPTSDKIHGMVEGWK